MCTAHTGIAACLLPHGATVHHAFRLPLETQDGMTCNIELGSPEGRKKTNYTYVNFINFQKHI